MQKLIDIWRVENSEGDGPYKGGSHVAKLLEEIPTAQAPLPMQDNKLLGIFGRAVTYPGYSFGFSSLESYNAWFSNPKHQNALKESGYFLAQYQVNQHSIRHGSAQLLFKKEDAALIRKLSCII